MSYPKRGMYHSVRPDAMPNYSGLPFKFSHFTLCSSDSGKAIEAAVVVIGLQQKRLLLL